MVLDPGDIAAMVASFGALFGAILVRRSQTRTSTHNINETVDDSVLGRFTELFGRIENLEHDLAQTKLDLAAAHLEISEMKKLTDYLEAKLHEKDGEVLALNEQRREDETEIINLNKRLESYRVRLRHLENFVKSKGYNPEEVSNGGLA